MQNGNFHFGNKDTLYPPQYVKQSYLDKHKNDAFVASSET